MKTIGEVSKITGVSLRALRHYDAIGLLKPTAVTEAGYRLYDEEALARLQSILFFRELRFPLKEIRAILNAPEFNPREALAQQLALLELQCRRLQEIIGLARELMRTGGNIMDFSAFDQTEWEQYAAEAREKWGATAAGQEYAQRAEGRTPEEEQQAARELMGHFARMGGIRSLPPDSPEAQAAVADLQQFITGHYYTCTPEILSGLGQLYQADPRFRQNIDAAGGEGTADFAGKAVAVFCDR